MSSISEVDDDDSDFLSATSDLAKETYDTLDVVPPENEMVYKLLLMWLKHVIKCIF
jgi:hypothetical protein